MKGKFSWPDALLVVLRAVALAVAALLADHTVGGQLTRLVLAPVEALGVLDPAKAESLSKSYSSSLYVPEKWSGWATLLPVHHA